ncbi:MAG TPA: hypothetical protein VGP80_04560 [Gemmatimonadales bacterium]|jgi:hypothetical protein|nr:hypothetical protein [Gemmatimonadales bacterium]
MVTLVDLWMPILVAAVIVFVASSIVHMVLRYHRSDYKGLPNEDAVRNAVGPAIAPGQYMFPYCADMKDMKSEAMQKKWETGPVGVLTTLKPGKMNMGPMLFKWFLYTILISALVGYLAEITLERGATYMVVFRVAATAALLGYAGGSISQGIWMGRPWSTVTKDIIDGAIYAMLTAGTFGWLWPR